MYQSPKAQGYLAFLVLSDSNSMRYSIYNNVQQRKAASPHNRQAGADYCFSFLLEI